jgi:hypothetical protein
MHIFLLSILIAPCQCQDVIGTLEHQTNRPGSFFSDCCDVHVQPCCLTQAVKYVEHACPAGKTAKQTILAHVSPQQCTGIMM